MSVNVEIELLSGRGSWKTPAVAVQVCWVGLSCLPPALLSVARSPGDDGNLCKHNTECDEECCQEARDKNGSVWPIPLSECRGDFELSPLAAVHRRTR